MIRQWMKRNRERKSREKFNAGFDYAVGAILRKEASEDEMLDSADNPFDSNEFESGIIAGVHALREYGQSIRTAMQVNQALDETQRLLAERQRLVYKASMMQALPVIAVQEPQRKSLSEVLRNS